MHLFHLHININNKKFELVNNASVQHFYPTHTTNVLAGFLNMADQVIAFKTSKRL